MQANTPICFFRTGRGNAVQRAQQSARDPGQYRDMRTFIHLRKMLASHADLAERLEELEQKYDKQFRVVFDAIRQMMMPEKPNKEPIGFKVKEKTASYQ